MKVEVALVLLLPLPLIAWPQVPSTELLPPSAASLTQQLPLNNLQNVPMKPRGSSNPFLRRGVHPPPPSPFRLKKAPSQGFVKKTPLSLKRSSPGGPMLHGAHVTYEPVTQDDLVRYLEASKRDPDAGREIKGLTPEQFQKLVTMAEKAQPEIGPHFVVGPPGSAPGRRLFLPPDIKTTYHYYKPEVYHSNIPEGEEHSALEHLEQSHSFYDEDAHSRLVVMEALWRAIKSVTGGVLAIGGAFARNSGRILEAKGRLMQTTGPLILEMGRIVADDALHNKHPGHELHPSELAYEAQRALEHHKHVALLKAELAHHHPSDSFSKTAWDLASTLRLSAQGATKAIFTLVSELSSTAKKAYLLKS